MEYDFLRLALLFGFSGSATALDTYVFSVKMINRNWWLFRIESHTQKAFRIDEEFENGDL